MQTDKTDLFPCKRIPDDPHDAKLIGLYTQAQDGLWLQRVKVPGGRLSGPQWRAAGATARRFTPDTPLHLTTRQDLEIHDLTPEQIPGVQEQLHRAGLTCFRAAGDTPRNVTVCPCSGTLDGRVDLTALAARIEHEMEAIDGIYSLPRKFKISLSCSTDCGKPWINDLGFVAEVRDGQWGFIVTGAGSLGARPGTGILLYPWLAATDVLALVVAAIRLFAAEGDRSNRRKARLRHVRERLGDEAFRTLLADRFAAARSERQWPAVEVQTAGTRFAASATLTFVNGDVTPEAADALAALAEDPAAAVRIDIDHRVVVYARDADALARRLADLPALAAAAERQPTVVACPGKRWCRHAIVHTNELADRIRSEFAGRLPDGCFVALSGCPNGCAQPAVADIGLVGCVATVDDERQEAFNLLVGGGCGRDDRLAEPAGTKLTPAQVIAEIALRLDAVDASS